MMRVFWRFISTVGFVLVLYFSAFAQNVQRDYDKKANFSQYKTYEWGKVQTTNPLWQQRIKDDVDKDLQAKGWQKAQSGGDVVLTAVGASHTEQEYQTFYTGLGPRWHWRGFGPDEATTNVYSYKVGTLVVDMYDAKSNQLIWRSTADDTMSDKPEKNEKKLEKAINKMFDKFPPGQEK